VSVVAIRESAEEQPVVAPRDVTRVLPLYVAAIAVAEILVDFVDPLAGMLIDALVLLALANHYTWAGSKHDTSSRVPGDTAVLPVLALLPILRMASLALPLTELPEILWYGAVGAVVLVAAALAARSAGLKPADIGLRVTSWPLQIATAAAGIPLGLAAYLIARPDLVPGASGAGRALLGEAILLVCVGVSEEVVFRGLIQTVFDGVLRCSGVVWSSVLFTLVYLGSGDPAYVVFIAAVGLAFGWWVRRTGSIVGVAMAHGLLVTGLLITWPQALSS
jgi:membrane protease YdiL (CAAX protease family)